MIKLISNADSRDIREIYIDYFPRQKRNCFLLLDHFHDDPFINKTEEYIIGEMVKLRLSDYPEKELPAIIKEFMIKLNWQLFSAFSQRQDLERGISLALIISIDNKIYYTSFGRFCAAKIGENKFEKIQEWVNPVAVSYDKIGLLGGKDDDISFKINEIELEKGEYFLVLSSRNALEMESKGIHKLSIIEHLRELYEKSAFNYVLLENSVLRAFNPKYWVRKKRVNRTAIILLIVIIISSVYAFWGANIIDDLLARFKFQSREFTRNELKEQFILLQEQAQDLLTELSQEDIPIALIPQQKLKIEKAWELKFNHEILSNPVFDYNQIYLTGEQDVFAIDKSDHEIAWQRHFGKSVEVLRVVDANRLLVILSNGRVHCVNRLNGELLWNKEYSAREAEEGSLNLDQISLNQYRQLDESIFLIQKDKSLALGLIRNGEIVAEYNTEMKIGKISDYDLLDKCLYITSGKNLLKINIKVIL